MILLFFGVFIRIILLISAIMSYLILSVYAFFLVYFRIYNLSIKHFGGRFFELADGQIAGVFAGGILFLALILIGFVIFYKKINFILDALFNRFIMKAMKGNSS